MLHTFFATSLYTAWSLALHFCSKRGHRRRWAKDSSFRSHTFRCWLTIDSPTSSVFLCTDQFLSVVSWGTSTPRIWILHQEGDLLRRSYTLRPFRHPLFPQSCLVFSAFAPEFTVLRKLFLDFKRFLAGTWTYRGCRSSVTCRWTYVLLTAPRQIPGGAIRRYRIRCITLNQANNMQELSNWLLVGLV